MPSGGVFYGTVAVFVALLIVSSTVAAVYYQQYQQEGSQSQRYASELSTALASYRSLSSSYNASLDDYNRTLLLLADAVANLNTSTSAYKDGSAALSSLWNQYQRLVDVSGRKTPVYEVRMLLDFGNGTRRWYNDTSAQPGWNGYVVSLVLLGGRIQAVWYPQYGEHFVTGIDGVSQTSSASWFVWEFSEGGWTVSPTGADQLQVNNGTAIAWTLCTYDASFNPTCLP